MHGQFSRNTELAYSLTPGFPDRLIDVVSQQDTPPLTRGVETMAFTHENTLGYSESELAKLNDEWDEIVAAKELEPESREYYAREKQFADEVSRRTPADPEPTKYDDDDYTDECYDD